MARSLSDSPARRPRNAPARALTNNAEQLNVPKAPPKKAQLDAMQKRNEALEAKMAEMEDQLAQALAVNKKLKKTTRRAKKVSSIAKPKGSAGKGFSLQAAMKLKDKKPVYDLMRRTVRWCVDKAGLDSSVPFRKQPAEALGRIYRVAREKRAYLAYFENDWATAEFIKMLLRNRREYRRRCAAAGAVEEVDMEGLEEEEEEEEEMEDDEAMGHGDEEDEEDEE